jgi:hypothetical protein
MISLRFFAKFPDRRRSRRFASYRIDSQRDVYEKFPGGGEQATPVRATANPETTTVRVSVRRDYSSLATTVAPGFAGSFTMKVEPRPSSLFTSIVPP